MKKIKYFYPETEDEPECLTLFGERRLYEIVTELGKESAEEWISDNADLVAKWLNDDAITLHSNIWRHLEAYVEESAMIQLREEEK